MEHQSFSFMGYLQQQLEEEQVLVNNQQPPRPLPGPCPRCDSSNTKFCYYNNYSIDQPRFFCKTCKRYWTQGGSLRDIPIGGTSRKEKKPSKKASSRFNRKRNPFPAVSTVCSSSLQSTHTVPGQVDAFPGVSMTGGSTFIPDLGVPSDFSFQQPEVPRSEQFGDIINSDFNLPGGPMLPPVGSQQQQEHHQQQLQQHSQVFHSTSQWFAVDQSQILPARNSTPLVLPEGFNDGNNALVREDRVLGSNASNQMDGFQANLYSWSPNFDPRFT